MCACCDTTTIHTHSQNITPNTNTNTHTHTHTHMHTFSDDDVEGTGSHTPPPTYKMTEIIAPPDYNDALQDVLVSQQDKADAEKEEEEKDDMVEVPLNENEVRIISTNNFCD